MSYIPSVFVLILYFLRIFMIVSKRQFTRIICNKNGIKSIRFLMLVDSIDYFEDMGADELIISIYCIDYLSQIAVFVCGIVEAIK